MGILSAVVLLFVLPRGSILCRVRVKGEEIASQLGVRGLGLGLAVRGQSWLRFRLA